MLVLMLLLIQIKLSNKFIFAINLNNHSISQYLAINLLNVIL